MVRARRCTLQSAMGGTIADSTHANLRGIWRLAPGGLQDPKILTQDSPGPSLARSSLESRLMQ